MGMDLDDLEREIRFRISTFRPYRTNSNTAKAEPVDLTVLCQLTFAPAFPEADEYHPKGCFDGVVVGYLGGSLRLYFRGGTWEHGPEGYRSEWTCTEQVGVDPVSWIFSIARGEKIHPRVDSELAVNLAEDLVAYLGIYDARIMDLLGRK